MARKTKKFQSNAKGPITVHVYGYPAIQFEPGKTRTFETDDPRLQAALAGNSDLSEVKEKSSKKK